MKRKWLPKGLVLIGLVLLSPIVIVDWASRVNLEDFNNALEPVVRIPVESLRTSGSAAINFRVRSTRVSRESGDPFYTILWRSQNRQFDGGGKRNGWWIYKFSQLQVDVNVSIGGSPVTLSKHPHVSSGDSEDRLSFFAQHLDEVKIVFHANDPASLPDGELVVVPKFFGVNVKDRTLGLALEEYVYSVLRISTWVGIAVILLAG